MYNKKNNWCQQFGTFKPHEFIMMVLWFYFLGALSFAELGTVVAKSGGEYSYFQEAFSKLHTFWGPMPSFLCAWIYVMILRPVEVAVIVMTFAEYTVTPLVQDMSCSDSVLKLTALSALCKLLIHSLQYSLA